MIFFRKFVEILFNTNLFISIHLQAIHINSSIMSQWAIETTLGITQYIPEISTFWIRSCRIQVQKDFFDYLFRSTDYCNISLFHGSSVPQTNFFYLILTSFESNRLLSKCLRQSKYLLTIFLYLPHCNLSVLHRIFTKFSHLELNKLSPTKSKAEFFDCLFCFKD